MTEYKSTYIWNRLKEQFSCKDIALEAEIDLARKKAICPSCSHETLYITDDYFKCHHSSCDKKGDIFNFIEFLHDVDRFGALQILAKKAGIEVKLSEEDKKLESRSEIFKEFAEQFMIRDWSSPAAKYLFSRKLEKEFIEKKMIGYIPENPKGEFSDTIKEIGLPENLAGYILIPFLHGSQVVYFTGRSFDGRKPKYMNQRGPKTYIGTMRGPKLIITEGIFDQLLAEQFGYNCIGLAGSAGQIKLHQGIKHVVLAFDGDEKGREYTEKYAPMFCTQGPYVEMVNLQEGSDLADYLSAENKIENLPHVSASEYFTQRIIAAPKKKEYIDSFFSCINNLTTIDQDEAISKLSKAKPASIQAIKKDFKSFQHQNRRESEPWWSDNGKFNPPVMADILMEENHFIWDRSELYIYQDGIYRPNGETYLLSRVKDKLKDNFRSNQAEEVLKNVEIKFKNQSEKLDNRTEIINLQNGLLYWKENEFKSHTPDAYSTIQLPVSYNKEAQCPAIDKFINEVFPEDTSDFIFEYIGSCLVYDNRFEKAVLLVGAGANGKSTFLKLLKCLLGEKNISTESIQDISDNKFRAANMAGKLANIFPDLDNRSLVSTGMFKALVSGDTITAEKKFRDPFSFENKAKMIFSCNDIPRSYDTSHAFYRRLIIIRFLKSFPPDKADPTLIDKLTTEIELSGLFNKAIEGLQRLYGNGKFSIPESSRTELNKYREDNENVNAFINEMCKVGNHFEVGKFEFYEVYRDWCADRGIKGFEKQKFNRSLKTVIPSLREGKLNTKRSWKGVELKTELELEEEEREDIIPLSISREEEIEFEVEDEPF